MDKQLAHKLSPPLSPQRLERQWRGVEARTRSWWSRVDLSHSRQIYAGFSLAALAALALVLTLGRAGHEAKAIEGGSFSNAGGGPATLKLLDGSQVRVSPSGRVEFQALSSDAVRLVLAQGWVELDVTHVPGRQFVVAAGDVEVAVRGTHFRVELADANPKVVSVSVQRGLVDVRQRHAVGAVKQLGAGMSWTMGQREQPAHQAEPEKPAIDAAAPVASVAPPASNLTAREPDPFDELYKARQFKQAYDSLGEAGFARAAGAAGPKRLLELADAARLSGHPHKAASAFDDLRRRYRSDPRAGLSALELGRLRLDTFHDPGAALEAFRDAVALSSSPSVREDALARQAQALEALGNVAGCRRIRDDYLTRYPRGIHSASIARRCGGN